MSEAPPPFSGLVAPNPFRRVDPPTAAPAPVDAPVAPPPAPTVVPVLPPPVPDHLVPTAPPPFTGTAPLQTPVHHEPLAGEPADDHPPAPPVEVDEPAPAPDGPAFAWLGRRGWRPLLALATLSGAMVAPFAVLLLHRPELRIDLGLRAADLDRAGGVALAGLVLAAFVASLATRAADARLLLRLTAALAGVTALVGAGVADSTWLGIIVFVVVVFTGPVLALSRAYAYDVYGPGAGWRVAGVCWAGASLAVAGVGLWQMVDRAPNWGYQLAAVGLLALVGAVLLPGPRPADAPPVDAPTALRGPLPPLTVFLPLGLGVGLALVATAPVALDLLRREWEAGRKMVGLMVLVAGVATALVCACAHWYAGVARRSATHLTGLAGAAALVAAVLMVAGAASDTLIGVLACWGLAGLCAAFAAVATDTVLTSRGGPAVRHYHGGALLAGVAIGGLAVAAMPTLVGEFGRTPTIALAVVPLVVFGLLVMARYPSDPDAVAGHGAGKPAAGTTDAAAPDGAGLPVPVGPHGARTLLECRGIDAGYDGVQVLFGVDLTVEEGQIVALMGTNGAGKTTLLRTVSGLLTPDAGTLTFGGVSLAGFDATERVQLGMTQIAGGESLAPGLTVAENLTMFAHTLHHGRRSGARIGAAVDQAFAQFPRLAERRNQAASTLSGGEKQMLALAKAFVLRPRLLVIDEFSLGLAPKVVGELLPVVQQLNADGAAVLLVEQSVNVALSVAHHALFMEKGEIVFDGPAAELRDQPDLLRAVYLEGIGTAVGR